MQTQVPPAAGEAQETRPTSAVNPIGLYRNPHNGVEVGVIDPIQGDAVIRQGFVLIQEGREAAMKTQEEMDATRGKFLKKKGELDAMMAELNGEVQRHETSPGQAPDTSETADSQQSRLEEENAQLRAQIAASEKAEADAVASEPEVTEAPAATNDEATAEEPVAEVKKQGSKK